MSPIRTFKRPAAVIAFFLLGTFATSTVFAASSNTRKPVILDTQSGISDGQSGTVLQTAPLSRQPIVEAQPIASPAELAPNSSVPIVVAPYIELPGGGSAFPRQPPPGPAPHHRQ
ncbi:hypothetical protein [Burkholderia sp. WSM2232]|uniref:hypothetical protein n=1 Tax=Burkholderia sp. WSM2232 TaxID=944436 RepID=UPI0004164C9E|nr:hypothetical protein [Burkholderia sp. WSM2232]